MSSAQSMASALPVNKSQPSQLDQMHSTISGITNANNAHSANEAASLRDWQVAQNKIAMDYNSREALKNRDFQKMMSDTAHQRQVKDLLAAGLNPVLSAMEVVAPPLPPVLLRLITLRLALWVRRIILVHLLL